MDSYQFIRTAALQLQTDSKEVVKIAGIVQNLQHWLKKVINPEYRAQINKMDQDTQEVQKFMAALDKELHRIRLAIREGNLEVYTQALEEARSLALGFWAKMKEVTQEAAPVAQIIRGYTREDLKQPDFMEKFKSHLPSEYALEFAGKKKYNIPLKSVGWYKNLSPEMILVTGAGTLNILILSIKKRLAAIVPSDTLNFDGDDLETLVNRVREAIVGGTLLSVSHRQPPKDIKMVDWGTTEIEVLTAPFEVPGTGAFLTLEVTLVDPRTSKGRNPGDKLIWVTTRAPKLSKMPSKLQIGRSKDTVTSVIPVTPVVKEESITAKFRLYQLEKLAQLLNSNLAQPIKYTNLSNLELAQVLRQGYQLAFGADPTAQALAGGWAQVVLEAGRPIKLPCNNIGNIKATSDWITSKQPFFIKTTSEFTSSGKGYQDVGAKWRAYATPEEGAAGYWKLIGHKYPESMSWMAAGDPQSATVSLAMNHYFTANIEKYAKGVSGLYGEFLNKIAPQLPNLKFEIKAAPQEKLALKPWLKDYQNLSTPSDTSKAQTSTSTTTTTINESPDDLMQALYAQGPLEGWVKNAIAVQKLSQTSAVIIFPDSSFSDSCVKLEYARMAAQILRQQLAIKTAQVHCQDFETEIELTTLGSPLIVTQAVQAVCDSLSEALEYTKGIKLSALVVPGFVSKYKLASVSDLEHNYRCFSLKAAS